MSTINEHKESKETVTMTVVIPKSSRDKLGRVKGIYGCDSLACTVSSVIEDIVIPDLLRSVADREGLTHGQPTDEPMAIVGSLYSKEEIAMVEFCNKLKAKLGYDSIEQISDMIEADLIKIIDTTKPNTCEAGETPVDLDVAIPWEE